MMPLVFIGHGSPMNAIEDNDFTESWAALGRDLSKPEAVLVVSAHWYDRGLRVQAAERPGMIYDMYGFPDELYRVVYEAPGSPRLADRVRELLGPDQVSLDETRGFDHGNWAVLCRLYPEQTIPVIQLSLNYNLSPTEHFDLGRKLRPLREEGVLILGSGNVVHNLRLIDWDLPGGYDWADSFDEYIRRAVLSGDFAAAVDFSRAGAAAARAVPTPDHYLPLLYVLGAAGADEPIEVFNNQRVMGSMSMTCYRLG